jgi:ubiquinone/menaquinone biosynthesis C-methylase UbiE
MLTVDFSRFPIGTGDRVLDVGCGGGRHSFEAYRRGAHVVAFDHDLSELGPVYGMFDAMRAEGETPPTAAARAMAGDATKMPFPDGSFDRVIAAEILEHVPRDADAMAEIARVLRPGGLAAITVPAWFPERVCWALSEDYHTNPGGHVRIYTRGELETKLSRAGLTVTGKHHAHALHSSFWWLKCVASDDNALVSAYHKLLVWDIMRAPVWTRAPERALNPVLGKSLVLYARKS